MSLAPPPDLIGPILRARQNAQRQQLDLLRIVRAQQLASQQMEQQERDRRQRRVQAAIQAVGQGVPAKDVSGFLELDPSASNFLTGIEKARNKREQAQSAAQRIPSLAQIAEGPQVEGAQSAFQGGVAQIQEQFQGPQRAALLNALAQERTLNRQQNVLGRQAAALERFKAKPQSAQLVDLALNEPDPNKRAFLMGLVEREFEADSEFERLSAKKAAGTITPIENRRLLTLAAGDNFSVTTHPDGTMTISSGSEVGKPTAAQTGQRIDNLQRIRNAQELVAEMIGLIREDPNRAGFGGSLRSGIASVTGFTDAFLNLPGASRFVESGRRVLEDAIQTAANEAASERDRRNAQAVVKRFERLKKPDSLGGLVLDKTGLTGLAEEAGLADPRIGSLEQKSFFAALGLADTQREGGRIPIGLIDRFEDILNPRDIRGPRQISQKLVDVLRDLRRQERRGVETLRTLNEDAVPTSLEQPFKVDEFLRRQSLPGGGPVFEVDLESGTLRPSG